MFSIMHTLRYIVLWDFPSDPRIEFSLFLKFAFMEGLIDQSTVDKANTEYVECKS